MTARKWTQSWLPGLEGEEEVASHSQRKPAATRKAKQSTSKRAAPRQPQVLLPSPESLGLTAQAELPLSIEEMVGSTSYQQKLDSYSLALSRSMESPETPSLLSKTALSAAKALTPPPSAFSFSTMSYMPDPQAGGLISWPGIPPEAIQRLARTTVAPELIISTRIADVLRYSQRASHLWRPGWRVEMRAASARPSKSDLRDIRAAESFLANCNVEMDATQARKRDAAGY